MLSEDTRFKLFLTVRRPLLATLRMLGDPLPLISEADALARDPYPVYERLRRLGTVAPSRIPWAVVATGHHAVRTMLREGTVRPEAGRSLEWDSPLDPSLLSLDPPDHTRIRGLVAQAFTPRAIERMRDRARDVAERLLDNALARGGEIDLIHDFASPLPITMICSLLGLPAGPADMDRFRRWGSDVALSLEMPDALNQPRIDAAGAELERYFTAAFAERRRHPSDDVLTGLVQARDGGDRLSDRELVATSILILLAGFETTVNLIGNGTLALLRHPEQRDRFIADPEGLAAGAVEEVLRYDSPVQMTSRIVPADMEVDGVPLRRGQMVACMLGGANRDPTVFDDPARFDITRSNAREHLSFAYGAHHCLGAALARLEGEIALATLFRKAPGIAHRAPARRRRAQVLRGLETFPVRLRPVTARRAAA